MDGFAPVDEERLRTLVRQRRTRGQPPLETVAFGSIAGHVLDLAEVDARGVRGRDLREERRRVDGPGLQGRLGGQMCVERKGAVSGLLLLRVGAEDLEVSVRSLRPARRGEPEEEVRGPPPRVRAAGNRTHPGGLFDGGDPGLEVGHRDDEVVELRGNGVQSVHDPPGPFR